ncbi:hypothetical protein BGX30_009763 [Mortierella sp. GBA39]|nr:hypothetical protein BGX30_009763 [Mortierella sp. GBA39]
MVGTPGLDADPTVVPDAAAGGFGIAPAVTLAGTGRFGVAPALQAPGPYQEPDVELSKPLFPGHLKLTEFKTTTLHGNVTPESKMASMEHIWTFTHNTWHLIRVNPGPVRLDTSKCLRRGDWISADSVFAILRLLKHLKALDFNGYLFGRVEFWKLWDALPAKIESLLTTVNGLLTLLGIFPNLTQHRVKKVEENPRYTSSLTYTSLPPAPFGGQSLRKPDGIVQDWHTVFLYIPSIVVWEIGNECLREDVALLLKHCCLNLETFRTFPPWFIDGGYIAGIQGNHPTNQFLITHCHLREFDSIKNFIKIDEILREPWTCMGLKWLTSGIGSTDPCGGRNGGTDHGAWTLG